MKTSIFSLAAPSYWSVGLPSMPLRARTKIPMLDQWNRYCDRMPTPEEQAAWLQNFPTANIGLPLGAQSGLCMVDVDTDDQELIDTILDLLPESPWVRVGKKGMAIAYKWSGQANFKLKIRGQMVVELLGSGNQLVLPPSIHPETKAPYTSNSNLWEVMDAIPVLDPLFEDKLRLAIGGDTMIERKFGRPTTGEGASSLTNSRFARWLTEMQAAHAGTIRSAPHGDRNTVFYRETVRFANHVAAAGVDWATASEALYQAGLEAGLEDGEMRASLASAWRSCDPRRSWMNAASKWVYCSGNDCFFHPASGAELSPVAFETEFGHLSPEEKGLFRKFIISRGLITVVQGRTYRPGQPQGVIATDDRDWFNDYRPSPIAAVEGDPTPFVDLLKYLAPVQVECNHLTKILAHIVRHPEQKLNQAVMIQSRQTGIGKSTLMEILERLVGSSNFRKVTSDEILQPYTSYVCGNVIVLCEEVNMGVGLHAVNRLKDVISARNLPMRRLHENTRMVESFSNYFFFSNLRRPLQLEKADRRFFVIATEPEKRPEEYWTSFRTWMQANLGVIRHYLEQINLAGFNAGGEAPMTEAKRALISESGTAEQIALEDLISDGEETFTSDVVTLHEVVAAVRRQMPRATRTAIVDALNDCGAVAFGQVNVATIGQKPRRQSLWAIRNVDHWVAAPTGLVVAEYKRMSHPAPYANQNTA